ncbi:c-type cytochrome [Planctomycetota bacterium]
MKQLVIHLILALLVPGTLLFAIDCYAHKRVAFFQLTSVDRSEGRRLFAANCSRCHSLEESPFQKLGPNLVPVRNREHHVNNETLSVPQYVLQSILDPDAYRVPGFGVMPKNVASQLSDDQLRNLVAYISGSRHDEASSRLDIPKREPAPEPVDITIAEARLGEQVLREKGKCLTCHSYYQAPEYHALAPNLLTGAYKDIEQIKQHITKPSATIADEYKTTRVQTVDGLVLSGRRVGDQTDDRFVKLLVQNAAGNYEITTIAADDIEVDDDHNLLVDVLETSPMPADFANQLSPAEIDAVAKVISSLNE